MNEYCPNCKTLHPFGTPCECKPSCTASPFQNIQALATQLTLIRQNDVCGADFCMAMRDAQESLKNLVKFF